MKRSLLKLTALAAILVAAMTMGYAQDVPITLNPGWNWISYPLAKPMGIEEALSGLTPVVGDQLKSKTQATAWDEEEEEWDGTLQTMTPGLGYMFYSAANTTRTFIFGGATNDPTTLPEEALEGEFTVDANGTQVRFSPGNLQCRVDPTKESQFTVGTETETSGYMPYNTYFRYSLCQMIFKAEELSAAGLMAGPITGIAFESYSSYHYIRNGIQIWISPTTLASASSTSVSTSGMTQMFNGTVTQQTGWTEIAFTSNSFNWDGTSNLIVTVVMNHGAYDNYTYWQCSSPGFTCSSYKYNDYNPYDPSSSTYSSMYTSSRRPNIRIKGKGGLTWRFAEHQTDYIGEGNRNTSSNYYDWIDLFGWGTSGQQHGAVCWQPYSTSTTTSDYYAYGDENYNLYDETGEADWGCNAISNGGDQPNQWRTLTSSEWNYLLYTRTTSSGKRYAKATVNGVNGLILLPDNWSTSYYTLNSTNSGGAAFTSNTISASQWQTLEQHGAVFLPADGFRYGSNTVGQVNSSGYYWASNSYDGGKGYYMTVSGGSLMVSNTNRYFGLGVRLVCQSNPRIRTIGMTNVTSTTATANVEVDYTGNATVTERGVCWNTTGTPTVSGNHLASGSGTGSFSVGLTYLSSGSTYHVRAYAMIDGTYYYGNDLSFTTDGNLSVSTAEVTNVTTSFALCGGSVSDCGQNVTARGLCWGTTINPTIDGSHSYDGKGSGSFTSMVENLEAGIIYYVRAYATTAEGTYYGNQRSFQTASLNPVGTINGLFSIGTTEQVYFSQGNLQYKATTNTWRFATNQWDYVGSGNASMSSTYSGWIDLFGWGTSGYNHGAECYQPWSTTLNFDSYYAYGNWNYNLYDQTGKADWGYNAISNGGNTENSGWRTLTWSEWKYIFNSRITASGIRFAKANVNNVNGIILLPDDWSANYYSLSNTNDGEASFSSNTISASNWSTLEQHGAVFLPAAGSRYQGTTISSVGTGGEYWSSQYNTQTGVYRIQFWDTDLDLMHSNGRSYGYSVRLVRNAQ